MATPPVSRELAEQAVAALDEAMGNQTNAAEALGVARSTFQNRLKAAARYGLMGFKPVPEGFEVSGISSGPNGEFVRMRPERSHGGTVPEGHVVAGVSTLLDEQGRVALQWVKTREDKTQNGLEEFVAALRDAIEPARPLPAPALPLNSELVNAFIITDYHLGMLADADETGVADWDLKIAEDLLIRWFEVAIAKSPDAETAILAQLGDLNHYDSMDAVTPASGHVLDADSRPQKMIRVAIRVMRKVVQMLLTKHKYVHFISADANHDPIGSAWQREFWAMHYADEPRITVEQSADTYYAYEFGENSLFFHHGHKRNLTNIDHVFAGKFREMFGRTKFSYAHTGHLHQQAIRESNLMIVEQHSTLAPEDAYANRGGWSHQRNAKVITYHKQYGEVSRSIVSPKMVYSFPH